VSCLLAIDLLTLFPAMAEGFLRESIIGRAQEQGLLSVRVHNLRDWALDKHRTTDDRPFGGGAGMVLKPEPAAAAIEAVATPGCTVIYLCPDGEMLTTALARELAGARHLVLLSGHYEGLDQRVRDLLVTREVSIGDYVLTNGTLPAAVLIDCVARQVPGVLGEELSLTQDSFHGNLLGFPQYTRPVEFRGRRAPEVLLSGNHEAIAQWRHEQQLAKTRARRPDLLAQPAPPPA
jgi:tRNA (guanine37-N1)-methyltransferase